MTADSERGPARDAATDSSMASASPQADAESSRAYECEHVGCPNGCTTRTGLCASCARDRFAALRRVAEAAKERYARVDAIGRRFIAAFQAAGAPYDPAEPWVSNAAWDLAGELDRNSALDALASEATPSPTPEDQRREEG